MWLSDDRDDQVSDHDDRDNDHHDHLCNHSHAFVRIGALGLFLSSSQPPAFAQWENRPLLHCNQVYEYIAMFYILQFLHLLHCNQVYEYIAML